MSEDLLTKKVGDLSAMELVQLLSAVMDRRREGGDPRLMELTVADFTKAMLSSLRDRSFQTAEAEANVAERILSDWGGMQSVQATTSPFRVRTKSDLEALMLNLEDGLTSDSFEYVVAVAIVGATPNGGVAYRAAKFP